MTEIVSVQEVNESYIIKCHLGRSVQGRPIELFRLGHGPIPMLLLAGVHGDEPEGRYLLDRLLFENRLDPLRSKVSLYVIPRLNPDGCELGQRVNANGVDLNRNMPTKDWQAEARAPRYNPGSRPASELESQIFIETVKLLRPRFVMNFHSWKPMINYNGDIKKVAQVMSKFNSLKVDSDMGYPTPGSMGTWMLEACSIPSITLEIAEGSNREEIWSLHSDSVLAGFLEAAKHCSQDSLIA